MKKPQHDLAIFGSQDLDGYFFCRSPWVSNETHQDQQEQDMFIAMFHYIPLLYNI